MTFVQPQSNADEHVDVPVVKKEEDQEVRETLESELRKINVNPSTMTLDSLKRAVGIIKELGWLPLWLEHASRKFIAPYESQPRFLPHDTTDQIRLGNVVSDQYKHDLDTELKIIKGQVDLLVNLVFDNFDKLFAGNFHEKKHFESRRLSVQNSIGYMMKRYPGEKRVIDLDMEFGQNWLLNSEKVNHLMSSDDREDPVFLEFQNFVGRVKEALVSLCKKESR